MAELPDGTVTLLFSDMEGSTALVKRLGGDWPGVVARHRELLRVAVEAEGGHVVDCQGDAMSSTPPACAEPATAARCS